MRTPTKTPSKLQPLGISLARLRSAAAVVATLMAAVPASQAATVNWDGNAIPTPGDGFLWTNPLNWDSGFPPFASDDAVFGNPLATVGTILLGGNQTVNSLAATESYTLGAYGTNQVLTNTSGNIAVTTGDFLTINASYGGSSGINLTGGGSLFMNHPLPSFLGNISIDGAGTTLVYKSDMVYPQYNGVGSAQGFGRGDWLTLGYTTVTKTITLSNGGEFKYLGAGNNPEANYKNILIGTGGGTLNLAAGFTHLNLDDVGQLANSVGSTFTQRGNGRLTIGGAMADANTLAGDVVISGGIFELARLQGGVTTANTRFAGVTGTTSTTVGTNTLTINAGGAVMLNNGTIGNLDVATVILNGGILATQGNTHHIGVLTQGGATPASTLQINGTTSTMMTRDLFGVQTGRNFFINSDLTGAGVLNILPSTQNASASRIVLQRAVASTFSGTFKLFENANLELNPRANVVVDTGKLMADGDLEFAGWGSTLDLRDSDGATANVKDYSTNEITISSTQAGSLNSIAIGRATAATGTGHLINFGTLTMGTSRLAFAAQGTTSSYQSGLADTASIRGNAVIEMRSNATAGQAQTLVLSNPVALTEDAAGRSLTLIKTGVGTSVAADVIAGGSISISNLEVATGNLILRGASGAITTAFGGAAPTITVNGGANFTNGLPTFGTLSLDSNGAHVVGSTTVIAAANNNDRIADSAILNMRSNSVLRLTSLSNTQTTETVGTTNVSGHATFDVVKSGTPAAPVALTLTALNMTGTGPTANFTGTTLGIAGGNSSRIVIPGTALGFMGAQFHSGNEWAKYDNTLDNGFELGVTPFVAGDYNATNTAEATWLAGQQVKLNAAVGATLTANRSADRINTQITAANQAVNVSGFVLTLAQGGILNSATTVGYIDGVTGTAPGANAGLTAGTIAPAKLYVYNTNQIDIRTPIRDNLGLDGVIGGGDDNMVDFVKSGSGTVRLTHQGLAVGTGVAAITPFTAATWTSTLTGSWIIDDGRLEVHRGQFLGGRPVILNGGHLEINQPVSNANTDSIIPNWGNNITVNGNATIASDDNGETDDASGGDRNLVKLGSLIINNGAILGLGQFSQSDIAFMGGATFNGNPTLTGVGRSDANCSEIINGVLAGTGFTIAGYNPNFGALELGGTVTDTAANTYDGIITIFNGTVRVNKANNVTAITDGAASEDVIINGGTLAWGTGQHGDLLTTNNVTLTNNGVALGITPMSPAAIKAAGQNQIADTATITLLAGTLGEGDRFNNEVFGTLNQKSGTLNTGLGTMEITTVNVTGGGLNIDRSGTFKAGTLNLLPGAYSPGVTTGIASPGLVTTLEIGAGGLTMTGQNITVGSGSSGNVAGAGAVLKLGGNVTVTSSTLLGNATNTGIYIQLGSSFREIGTSRTDLAGGVRDFNIAPDVQFYITTPLVNGGLTKSGNGALNLEPYQVSSFAGPITVNGGVLAARGDGAFGTSAGGVTVNSGGTVKLESSWVYGDSFTISGPGATVPGEVNVREIGALISDTGTNRITGAVALAADATIASNIVMDPSVTPGAGGAPAKISNLVIASPLGITGASTLTLSGHGDGVVVNGLNTTAGGLVKNGAGRWTITNASAYVGDTTINAGNLRITNGAALGTTVGTTTVYGGALELDGGISSAEPLKLYGDGSSVQSGAVVNVSGANTLTGAITLGANATLRSSSGLLFLGAAATITGVDFALTLSGNGNGSIAGNISLGSIGAGDAITKSGRGTWTLAGLSSFSGSTAVNAGNLNITSAGAALDPLSSLNMGGGNITVSGAAQTVGALNLASGGSGVSGGAGLTVGSISRNAGATATFAGLVNAASSTNTNGILGSHATVGSDWATLNGSFNVVAFTGYVALDAGAATVTDNSSLAHFTPLGVSPTRNSLKITGGSGLDLGANNLTLSSGGLMYAGSAPAAIGGTGTLSASTAADEVILNVSGSGTLDIAAPVIGFGSGSLTKTGNGTLVLSGNSGYSGSVNINGGTLSIVGPGGTNHPNALGTSTGPRNLNINGGTFEVVGGDYDSGATNMYYVIGSAGATIRSTLGSIIHINDGLGGAAVSPFQLSGAGDITFSGGGRYNMANGAPTFPNFTGNITVESGILTTGATGTVGGRPEQTITLKAGSALINQANFALGLNGLPNNLIVEGGVELYGLSGSRAFAGNVQFSGTNTIALLERDLLASERQLFFNGRVSGTGVTLNVFGVVNNTPMYLAGGSNDLTGTINLNPNAVLEVRTPGSLGQNNGDVTVNLNGANSRLLLRSYQNADYHANVTVSNHAEINSDRLVNYAGGANQLLTINNLSYTAADKILTVAGGNTYMTRVAGTATFSANAILNATGNILFENGLAFTGGATNLDKRGGGSVVLRGAANQTGTTIIQGGLVQLQNGGTLLNTSSIELRGGELRIDNSEVANADRLNDAGNIILGGGVLRITGVETTLPTITAVGGTTQIISNPASETVPVPLVLTGFTRALGSVVQFQSPDIGAGSLAVGATTNTQSRIGSRIFIPGQVNTTQTIPGLLGSNSLDFVQYDGTTLDNGVALGVRDMRNPGTVTSPSNYTNDPAETAFNDTVIARLTNGTDTTTVTTTLTANRALEAIKVETGGTARIRAIALGGFQLRIEGAGILDVSATTHTFNVTGTGSLTAGPAVPGVLPAELFLGGTGIMNINSLIVNNGAQPLALVKTGTGTVNLGGSVANTYMGGTYVDTGVLNLTVNNALGPVSATNKVFLNGGTLQFNIASASSGVALGGLGHNVTVGANSTIIADNGALAGINNSLDLGGLAITGPYTLGVRGFDSMDVSFTGTHNFAGVPTIDLAQAGSGSNPNTVGTETFLTIGGAITGSGFYVTSSGSADNTQARLRIGSGAADAANNTYTGKLTTLQGNFTEDTFVELNKGNVGNPIAITGDLELNGGTVLYNFDNQIADGSNIVNNRGILNFNGKSDTIASVNMRGGGIITNPTTLVQPFNAVSITGDLEVTGYDDFGGVTTGFTVGNNSTVTVGGQIRIGTFGRIHLAEGQTGAVLNVNGGLQMTGALLSQNNGAGANIVRLSSDVSTFASVSVSRIGNSLDSDTYLELNGTRIFTVADGAAGLDLSLSTVIRDSTAPVAVGGLTKVGPGVMQIEGGASGNSYTGPTVLNEGKIVLNKNAGVNATGNGSAANTLTLGDGAGGAKADQLILRASNQIADPTAVTILSSGLLDLDTFNASETIGDLIGAVGSAITLGPTSVLTVGTATAATTYAGSIEGGGTLTKQGTGALNLTGALNAWTINANAGTTNVGTNANYAVFNANATTNFSVSQTLTALNIADGVTVTFGDGLPFAGAPDKLAGFGGSGAVAGTGVVPEPGSMGLLLVGALGLLGRRRRR